MKKIFRTLALAAVATLSATAQNTESAYFTDGNLFRHEMNPAIGNDNSYISMPGIGNINIQMTGNLGISDVLYRANGKTVLFTNPLVSTSEFLGNIKDKNRIGADLKMQILGVGFKAFGGYNTIGINLRTNADVKVPGTLLTMAKEGLANKTYDIGGLKATADVYAELALNHSRQLNDQLRVGATLKVLIGGAHVDANISKATATLDNDHWTASTEGEVNASVKGLKYKMSDPSDTHRSYVNDINTDDVSGPNGFGLAIDLGAEYKLNDDWKFSAALLDLGFISWSNNMVATTNGERQFNTDNYTFVFGDEFKNEWNKFQHGLSDLYGLEDKGDQGGRTTGLGATMNLGAEYTLPVYRKISFGLLNTTRIHGDYSWTNFRLSANWKAAKIFALGTNLAVGTYGCSFGWIADFHPKGFNFFLGMDHTFGKMAKQGLPLSSNGEVTMGINFPF